MRSFSFNKQSQLVRKREIKGLFFVAPFLIGFFAFIFFPMLQSLIYSFNDLVFDGNIKLNFAGLNNYYRAFFTDTEFRKLLLDSIADMVLDVPIIIIFSMLIAIFLNGKFAGQSIFQIIFFIPVIVSSGILPDLFAGDKVRNAIIGAESMTGEASSAINAGFVGDLFVKMNLPSGFIEYIMYAITNILGVLNSSGIQILVFLIALKAIPASLFEASKVEGATPWESFWKITFPMVLPQMIVNVVYTIIDSFSNNLNPVMKSITEYNFVKFQFGYAASLSWIYFLIVIVILLVMTGSLKLLVRRYN